MYQLPVISGKPLPCLLILIPLFLPLKPLVLTYIKVQKISPILFFRNFFFFFLRCRKRLLWTGQAMNSVELRNNDTAFCFNKLKFLIRFWNVACLMKVIFLSHKVIISTCNFLMFRNSWLPFYAAATKKCMLSECQPSEIGISVLIQLFSHIGRLCFWIGWVVVVLYQFTSYCFHLQ